MSATHSCYRTERILLYQHMAHTLAAEWGSDISSLVSELESEQQKLKALYDRASLQVGTARLADQWP